MKKMCFLFVFLTAQVQADIRQSRIIYGEDNRVEPYQASEMQKKLAVATAGMISSVKIVPQGDYVFLPPASIESSMGLCSDERFADQPSSASCSGFLIGPDLLVTAGHCITDQTRCDEVSWVFDYKVKASTKRADMMIPKSKVYKCKDVIDSKLEMAEGNSRDYALIRLDRPVLDRTPLKIRKSGKISNNQEIFVIGHPSGLPTKVAGDAKVFANNSDGYFETNLDTFGGNSGSAVFNAQTGVVEGILVRGAKDYEASNGCARVFEAPQDITGLSSLGESVSRITDIDALKTNNNLISAIQTGENRSLPSLIQNLTDLNIAGENMNTALHIAIDAMNTEAAEMLINAGANLDVQNISGETPLHRAAFKNNRRLVSLLILKGADILVKDKFGQYPSGRTNYFAFKLRGQLRRTEKIEKQKRLQQ